MVTQQQLQDALRHLHGTKFVETEIAKRFTAKMPGRDPRDAFVAAVSASFDCAGIDESAELRDLVFQSDIDTTLSRTVAAHRCNLSVRSFYRKRQMALRVIAEHFNRILGNESTEALLKHLSEADVSPEHEGAIDATFNELRSEFDTQRSSGDVIAMQTVVARVAAYRALLSPWEALEMRMMQAEIAIKTGDFDKAAALLRAVSETPELPSSRRLLCLALLQHARLAMSLGNVQEAIRLTLAIVQACAPWERQWAQAHALLGRACALTGSTWSYIADPNLEAEDNIPLQAVQARHTFLAGAYAQAHRDSLKAFEEARSRGVLPAAAYAAATLSLCYGSVDPATRDSWAVTALRLFASCGSTSDIAIDLFQFGAHRSTVWLTHAKESDLLEIYCCLRGATNSSPLRDFRPFIGALLQIVVRETAGRQTAETALDDLVELAWEAARGTGGGVAGIAEELESLKKLGEFLKVLLPAPEQPQYAARFNSTAGIVVRAVTRELSHRQIRALSHVS